MAYRLNRHLQLQTPARVADGAGGFTQSWMPLGQLWAHVITRAGREAAGAASPMSRVSYKIIVRGAPVGAQSRPQPDQRFVEDERVFRILAVAEDDADGRYLVCTAQEETVA